jgi:hypothetical protein
MNQIELAHAFSCLFMTGLIWLVQIVHYPAFAYTDEARFSLFHGFHSRRITWIVFPVMTLELVTAAVLVFRHRDLFWTLNGAGVALLWASTAFLSVPLHNRLAAGTSTQVIEKLVLTNWPRTLLWTIRAIALFFALTRTQT